MSRDSRLVELFGFDGAGREAAVAAGSGVGLSMTPPSGDAAAVGGGEAWTCVGAGMTVTTADGEAVRRRRVGEGDGFEGGVGLACGGSLVRLGLGNGGGGTIGDGELEARASLVPAVGPAVTCGLGVGVGLTACAEPISSVGVSSATARLSSSGRRRSGTRRL